MNDKEKKEALDEIYAHLDDIMNNADRMTSGNFMHHKNATKLSAKIVKNRLQALLGEAKVGVVKDSFIYFEDDTWVDLDPSMCLKPAFDYKDGDKVRVLTIKEE